MSKILKRARPDIVAMTAYSSARSLMAADPEMVFLDANECPYEPVPGVQGYSRYANQQPDDVVLPLANLYGVATKNIVVTRGADEAIDILVRCFCEPGEDNILVCPPTFAMYGMSAQINKTDVKRVPLNPDMQLDVDGIKSAADENTKIIFICSPNNPTGNLMKADDILGLCAHFDGKAIVAVDETYLEYTEAESLSTHIEDHDNLLIFRTTSKAYATAGIRFGAAIARTDIIELMRKVLPPYPIPAPTIHAMKTILSDKNVKRLQERQKDIVSRRDRVIEALNTSQEVEKTFPTDANFVLVKFKDAQTVKQRLKDHKIIVRDMSHNPGLENCIRISIGSDDDMNMMMDVINGNITNRAATQRIATITRTTKETAISVTVNLDKPSPMSISTGLGFYDHMLDQIAKHGGIGMQVECDGDIEIDSHHTIEDCAIALGQALSEALGDKVGVARYGAHVPMDESLAHVSLDLSGRPYLVFKGEFPERLVGEMPTDMVEHFFKSLSDQLKATVHIEVSGNNTHHMVEACFKGFARALKQAIAIEGDSLPSTKGSL